MNQEFTKTGPSQGCGMKQNKQTLKRNVKLAFV